MPIQKNSVAALGLTYMDIRVGGQHTIHQVKLDVSALTGVDDANGTLPPGLPIIANGGPCGSTTDVVVGVIGPEPVHLASADHFGNVIMSGVLDYDAIKANLGRVWDANELASVALVKAIRLVT